MRIDWQVGKLCDKMVGADSRKSFPEKYEMERITIADGAGMTLSVFRKKLKQSLQEDHQIKETKMLEKSVMNARDIVVQLEVDTGEKQKLNC